ncbi:MAG: hypothetical protein IK078_08200 [Lachnospiraceae bacterium]|nr:hypothetical protein [Lachnospiraceae bacterium]
MGKTKGALRIAAAVALTMTILYVSASGTDVKASMTEIDVTTAQPGGNAGSTPVVAGVNDQLQQENSRQEEEKLAAEQAAAQAPLQRTDVGRSQSASGQSSSETAGSRVSTAIDAAFGELVSTPSTQQQADTQLENAAQEMPMTQQEQEEEQSSLPEWTEKLITGRGESESGFTGGGQDLGKVDANYEGQLDPVTGQPVDDSYNSGAAGAFADEEPAGRVRITDTMYYDYDLEGYVFISQRFGTEISSNVADGMVTRGKVVINVPEGVTVTLYQDGNPVEDPVLQSIQKAGAYVLRIGNGSENEDLLTFTIVEQTTGNLNYYDMPEGFQLTAVTLDGTDVMNARSRAELLTEGSYKIDYKCVKTDVYYELSIDIDHTAPQLVFTGVDENGRARGPVEFSGVEKGDTITCLKDGRTVNLRGHKLRESGQYELTVTDQAGNESTYYVMILLYLNMQGVVFLALFLAVITAIIVYLQYVKRKLRVR